MSSDKGTNASASPSASAGDLDTLDLAAVRSFSETILPDPDIRETILSALAESIVHAHEQNPSGWEISVNRSRHLIRLNVGRIFVFDVFAGEIAITADRQLMPADLQVHVNTASHKAAIDGFVTVPGASWYSYGHEEFGDIWQAIREAHFKAIDDAASSVQRTPVFPHHVPAAIEYLAESTGRSLPSPNYDFTRRELDGLLSLLRRRFPSWDGFDHQPFFKDEIEYKREAVAIARELLSAEEMQRLRDEREFDELIKRVEKVGQSTNLLFLGVPKQGDLGILYQEGLDRASFTEAFQDLLYGTKPAPQRFGDYLHWVQENGLPNKWTFPTYFLFLLHHHEEMFVKPSITSGFIDLIAMDERFRGEPSAEKYALIRAVSHKLRDALREDYGAEDMIDVQSLMYVAAGEAKRAPPTKERRSDFEDLYNDFVKSYPGSDEGQWHGRMYESVRATAIANWKELLEARARGRETTDFILLTLLPHSDTQTHRDQGAWVHHAPAIAGDMKKWFEANQWVAADDWPQVAEAIFQFVQRCVEIPGDLESACQQFADHPATRGLQTGMLTPILNALRPEFFVLVNNKSRRAINYFSGRKHGQSLLEYPAANATANELIDELEDILAAGDAPELRTGDLLDMFSHWLIAVRKYPFGEKYWKISPGENAWQWDDSREGGFIGMGWDEFGDLSVMSRDRFRKLQADFQNTKDWKAGGTNQLWRFAKNIKEGDRIVANRGTTEILGVGTVTGPYHFVEGEPHSHRLPVEWDDTTVRSVAEGGWKRTIVKLNYEKFREITSAPPVNRTVTTLSRETTPQEGYFSQETFVLLRDLHRNPSREFYSSKKTGFEEHVERPFKTLFTEIVRLLPPAITDRMETEKGLFSRISKNDYGRGGAWDYFWGALYPEGGRRISHPQLFMVINRHLLGYGFYIGEYGKESRETFLRNVRIHRPALLQILKSDLDREDLLFGSQEDVLGGRTLVAEATNPGWGDWLTDPASHGIRVGNFIPANELLRDGSEAVVERINEVFTRLFPLVLLAASSDPMAEINAYLESEEDGPEARPHYDLSEFAADSGFDLAVLTRWVRAIKRKGQAILYGPPGTGKTYAAERLARHLVGGGTGIRELVQFHPAYAYEDFMQGIRPSTTSSGDLTYDVMPGRFLDFCRQAARTQDPCVLIIDEINRANLSRVFGELMYLLEYRDRAVPLAGGGEFTIPSNVWIIGTMNTADRSIALVDHALRRRFAFLRLQPDYQVLRHFHERAQSAFSVAGLIKTLSKLNSDIRDPHYEVGITFFLHEQLAGKIEDVWRMEIEPYLEEFFFNQPDKLTEYGWDKVQSTILSE